MPRPQEKVSLHPLDFKEALSDLLKVKPVPEPESKEETTSETKEQPRPTKPVASED